MSDRFSPHSQSKPVVFVTTIYGERYLPFLAPHLYSVEQCYPGAQGAVIWQDISLHQIEILAAVFPHRHFIELTSQIAGEKDQKISRKLMSWLAACQNYWDELICFTDCDLLFVKPFTHYLVTDFDILFTWKAEKYPINTGFIVARNAQVGQKVLKTWFNKIEKVVNDGRALHQAVAASGAADQHTLRQMIGFQATYEGAFEYKIDNQRYLFQGVECRFLNETNCKPVTADTHVIHYKSGWHKVLLDHQPFTGARAEQPCEEMQALWQHTEQNANAHIIETLVFSAAQAHIDRFIQIAAGYEERGILHSEMLAVCGLCSRLKVDTIIESGRARGQSTYVLAKYFKQEAVDIISIDWPDAGYFSQEDDQYAQSRLALFENVKLLYGDSVQLLPQLMRSISGKRVAILLDGPKGKMAIDLLKSSLMISDNIVVAFIHDMKQETAQRQQLQTSFKRVFFTDDADYVSHFQYIDENCLPVNDEITADTWRPYMKGNAPMKSYGPTLGIVLPLPGEGVAPEKIERSHQRKFAYLSRFYLSVQRLGWQATWLRLMRWLRRRMDKS